VFLLLELRLYRRNAGDHAVCTAAAEPEQGWAASGRCARAGGPALGHLVIVLVFALFLATVRFSWQAWQVCDAATEERLGADIVATRIVSQDSAHISCASNRLDAPLRDASKHNAAEQCGFINLATTALVTASSGHDPADSPRDVFEVQQCCGFGRLDAAVELAAAIYS
jgi:hypothetical protein